MDVITNSTMSRGDKKTYVTQFSSDTSVFVSDRIDVLSNLDIPSLAVPFLGQHSEHEAFFLA